MRRPCPGRNHGIGDERLSPVSLGGVEIGGVLFGKEDSGIVHISFFRPAACEHHYGPAFELSENDQPSFENLLHAATSDEELAGLQPVGWYQSISRHELSLSERSRATFQQLFPGPWQIAMVVKRSKHMPVSIGIFARNARGGIELHSAPQEFALDGVSQPAVPESREAEEPLAFLELPSIYPELRIQRPETPLSGHNPRAVVESPTVTESPATVELPSVDRGNQGQGGPELQATRLSFAEDPFSAPPDVQFFFPSAQHREALSLLFHQIRTRAGFLALVGEPGTGKSIVLGRLMELLKTSETEFACLLSSKVTVPEFFELVAHDFRLPCASTTKTAIVIALNEYLLERSCAGLTTALIVDNAQKLSTEVLEEIELLGNLENRSGRLLQVLFAAQPGFERQLDAPELRGLKQRLMLWARLEPLDATQTAAYVQHRMSKAGAINRGLFSSDMLAEIHTRTRGVPRLINAVCGRVLERCRDRPGSCANVAMVSRVAEELMLSGFDELRPVLREAAHS